MCPWLCQCVSVHVCDRVLVRGRVGLSVRVFRRVSVCVIVHVSDSVSVRDVSVAVFLFVLVSVGGHVCVRIRIPGRVCGRVGV